MILSVDPGLRGIGAALFSREGRLLYANYIKNPRTAGDGPSVWFALADHVYEVLKSEAKKQASSIDTYVVETMVIYRKNTKGNPNDLIQVTGAAAAVGAALPLKEAYDYPAKTWKGQVPKLIHNERVLASLTEEERKILESAGVPRYMLHNVIDAIGIGLYHLEVKGIRVGRAL